MIVGGHGQFYEDRSGSPIHLETLFGEQGKSRRNSQNTESLARVQWEEEKETPPSPLRKISEINHAKISNG